MVRHTTNTQLETHKCHTIEYKLETVFARSVIFVVVEEEDWSNRKVIFGLYLDDPDEVGVRRYNPVKKVPRIQVDGCYYKARPLGEKRRF